MEDLALVFKEYGFGTCIWLIPSESSNFQLWRKAAEFIDMYESDDCLLIVYYGGQRSKYEQEVAFIFMVLVSYIPYGNMP
jgi:hypothetical protein